MGRDALKQLPMWYVEPQQPQPTGLKKRLDKLRKMVYNTQVK